MALLVVAPAVAAQGLPGVAPPPTAPADTRWAPPPALPSAASPYRPLVPADSPAGRRPPVTAAPTRPVLTMQKPAGADEPKADPGKVDPRAVPLSDPKLPPPLNPGTTDPKVDRDPPRSLATRDGTIDKNELFRLEDDADLARRITGALIAEERERIRRNPPEKKEDQRDVDPAYFAPPKADPLVAPGTHYQAKTLSYPGARAVLEPGYVVHRRLFFEDVNSERYGWDAGLHQPAISTLLFWKDVMLFPAKLASNRGEWYDTSAGKCLPGSPVPYMLYPEQLDAFGILVGAGTIVGTAAILHW